MRTITVIIDGEQYLLAVRKHAIHSDTLPEQQQCLNCASWETFQLYAYVQKPLFVDCDVPPIATGLYLCTECHCGSEIVVRH